MSNLFYVFVAVAIVAVAGQRWRAPALQSGISRTTRRKKQRNSAGDLRDLDVDTAIGAAGRMKRHRAAPPPSTEMAAFAYGRKVVTDLWTAIAVVLALLWGISK